MKKSFRIGSIVYAKSNNRPWIVDEYRKKKDYPDGDGDILFLRRHLPGWPPMQNWEKTRTVIWPVSWVHSGQSELNFTSI